MADSADGPFRESLEGALAQVTGQANSGGGLGSHGYRGSCPGQVIGFRHPVAASAARPATGAECGLANGCGGARLQQAEQDWHPRFSARRRHYRYTVLNQALRSPLDRRYAHLVTAPLDLAALQAASRLLVGEHDFASFGQPTQGENTVRYVFSAEWRQDEAIVSPSTSSATLSCVA